MQVGTGIPQEVFVKTGVYLCDYVCQSFGCCDSCFALISVQWRGLWPWGDSSLLLFSGPNLSGSGSLMATDADFSVLKDPWKQSAQI